MSLLLSLIDGSGGDGSILWDRVGTTLTPQNSGDNLEVDGEASFEDINLSSLWDISKSKFAKELNVSSQSTNPLSLFFKPDGLKMYIADTVNNFIYEYDLSTAWNILSSSYLQSYEVVLATTLRTIYFKDNGLKLYILGTSGQGIWEYDLSVAWDLSSVTYSGNSLSISAQGTDPYGISFKTDGSKVYTSGANNRVNEYDLSTAWNISTASFSQFYLMSETSAPTGVTLKSDGLKMYISDLNTDIFEYDLTTAWDISSSTYLQSYDVSPSATNIYDIYFKADGSSFYFTSNTGKSILEFNLYSNISGNTYFENTVQINEDLVVNKNVVIGTTSSLAKLHIDGGSQDTGFDGIRLNNLSTDISTNDEISSIVFSGIDDSPSPRECAEIKVTADGSWGGGDDDDAPASIDFYVQSNGTDDDLGISRLHIDSEGNIGIGTITPNTKIDIQGGQTVNVTTVNAATYDLLITDYILNVTYTTTGAVTSLTLPTAQTTAGRIIVIKDAGGNAGTNNITVDTEGSEKIDGQDTAIINGNYDSITLYSDGSNWFII